MSTGNKQVLQYSKETVFGTTPDPFVRKAIPFTTIELDSVPNKADSTVILDSRLAQKGAVVSVNHEGNLTTEMRYGVYDDFLASNAMNEWAGDTLAFGGDVKIPLSVMRGYKDANNYHVFAGTLVNMFELNIATESIVTMSFGLMSKSRTPSMIIPTGTVTTPTLPPPYTNVSVGDILIDGQSMAGIACISEFSFSWDNSMEARKCLGQGLETGNIVAKAANGTGSFTMEWSQDAWELYEKQFSNTTVGVVVPFLDSAGNGYTLTIPEMEITAPLPSGGMDDTLQLTVEYKTTAQAPVLVRAPFAGP